MNDEDLNTIKRAKVIYAVGSTIGLLIAYAVIIPRKLSGDLPPHMSWTKVLIAPPIGFGLFAALVWLKVFMIQRKDRKKQAATGEDFSATLS